MKKISVLVVEDHAMQRKFFAERLGEHPQIRVVGEAADGVEALEMVIRQHPQVVVLDLILPRMDGYALIEQLQHIPDIPHPAIVAITSLDREDFIRRAIGMCVNYYMVKPVDPDLLAQRVLEAAGATPESTIRAVTRSNDEWVHRLLLQLSVPPNLVGHRCLRCAFAAVAQEPELLQSLSRRLYPRVAQSLGMTEKGVERAIRHAIGQAWLRGGDVRYRQLLGRYASIMGEKPTNGEFLAQVGDWMQRHMHEKSPDRGR